MAKNLAQLPKGSRVYLEWGSPGAKFLGLVPRGEAEERSSIQGQGGAGSAVSFLTGTEISRARSQREGA